MNVKIVQTMEMAVGGILHCEHHYYGSVRLIKVSDVHLQMIRTSSGESIINTTPDRMNVLHGTQLY